MIEMRKSAGKVELEIGHLIYSILLLLALDGIYLSKRMYVC